MLDRPRKRIWPSLIRIARSKTPRHAGGLRKGSRPSMTNIRATALSATSQKPTPANGYFRGAAWPEEPLRIVLKKSVLGSITIRSLLLRKLAR